MQIDDERAHLETQILMRIDDYAHWWLYNSQRKNYLFFGSLACSLAVTIAGIFKQPETAGVFGAL